MHRKPIDGYLGFAARSRNCALGFQAVSDAIKQRKAKVVIMDLEIAKHTREKIESLCESNRIPIIFSAEPGKAVGKEAIMCLAVTDPNLADAIRRKHTMEEPQGVEHGGEHRKGND